eukprot:1989979-Lingulodinium_polyedra.AAC.1
MVIPKAVPGAISMVASRATPTVVCMVNPTAMSLAIGMAMPRGIFNVLFYAHGYDHAPFLWSCLWSFLWSFLWPRLWPRACHFHGHVYVDLHGKLGGR